MRGSLLNNMLIKSQNKSQIIIEIGTPNKVIVIAEVLNRAGQLDFIELITNCALDHIAKTASADNNTIRIFVPNVK